MAEQFTPLTIDMDIDDEPESSPWNMGPIALGVIERIGGIPNVTNKGHAAVAVLVRLPDGSTVVGSTTLRLLWNAARALYIRYEEKP